MRQLESEVKSWGRSDPGDIGRLGSPRMRWERSEAGPEVKKVVPSNPVYTLSQTRFCGAFGGGQGRCGPGRGRGWRPAPVFELPLPVLAKGHRKDHCHLLLSWDTHIPTGERVALG